VNWFLRLISCVVFLTSPILARAAAPPFPVKTITITARNQSVTNVVTDLFGQAGLRVKVSSAVNANMNGTFTASPAEIWSQLSRAFNLVAYYDGAIVRVYAASEIQTRSFATESPATVVRDAQHMQIADNSNIIAASTGSVSATGVPAFLERIDKLTASVKTAALSSSATIAPTAAILRNATPASASVISPILAGPAAIQTVRSSVIARASTRNPYEVRIFYLRYARADDTIQRGSSRTDVTPGLASILRGIMGDGRRSETVSTSGNFEIARQSLPRLLGRGLGATPPDASQQDYDDAGSVSNPEPQVQAAVARGVNGPRVEVDSTNNAVIVRDRPESMSVYEDIIRGLDVEPRGIEVEATILELDTTRLKELGIDFDLRQNDLSLLFGGAQTNPTQGFSPANIAANYLTGNLNSFNVRITALEKAGALRIMSRPRMSTLNNIPVIFNNQVTYYARVAGDRQVDLFPITAGLIMRVEPSVVYDGGELRTRMNIEITDGSPSGLVVDGIPAVKQSSINTNAVVKQGESLMIGGMSIDTEYDYKTKVPVVSDVPALGQLFRKRSKGGSHFERLFLITARILSQGKSPAAVAAATTQIIPLDKLQGMAEGRRIKSGHSR
jgi:type III secretion protein C